MGLARRRPLQRRDPDPDESASAIFYGELLREVHTNVGEDLLIKEVGAESPLSQVCLESFESDLDPDRPEGRALGAGPQEYISGHVADRRFHLFPVRDVLVERPLDADRLRIGPFLDRELLDPRSDRPKPD